MLQSNSRGRTVAGLWQGVIAKLASMFLLLLLLLLLLKLV
jgi:hypothetical protein